MNKRFDKLCSLLNYRFSDEQFLIRALTHRSYSAEHNERLEFLGDSVLGCVIAKYLYQHYPQLTEGDLSRLRSNLVREQTLVVLAQQLELGNYLRLGDGERKSGGASRPSMLADGMEALFGAVFDDGGFSASEQVVLGLYIPLLEQTDLTTLGKDPKTLLQELLQSRRIKLPIYTIVNTEGEAHAQLFNVSCSIETLNVTTQGQGNSRRAAEQQAAELAYKQIIS